MEIDDYEWRIMRMSHEYVNIALEAMNRESIPEIRWAGDIGLQLIKEVKFEINGVVMRHLGTKNGALEAIVEHIGISEEDCEICKRFKDNYSAEDFQYFYGTKHIRYGDNNDVKRGLRCYIGGNMINELSDEWLELWDELSNN